MLGLCLYGALALISFLLHVPLSFVLWLPHQAFRGLTRANLPDQVSALDGGGLSYLQLAVEAPLAITSWSHYHSWVRFSGALKQLTAKSLFERWPPGLYHDVLGDAAKENGGRLPLGIIAMCLGTGPRWNTHTNVNIGFFPIEGEGGAHVIEVDNIQKEGLSWQTIFYNENNDHIAEACPNKDISGNITLKIATNSSTKGIQAWTRMYLYGEVQEAMVPEVWMDGNLALKTRTYQKNCLGFNKFLREQQNIWFEAMHWYVFPMLATRNFWPEWWVRTEYLPVGNPATAWSYGVLHAGYALSVDIEPAVMTDYIFYYTELSRASIPTLASYEVSSPKEKMPVCKEDGFWMMRCVRKDGGPADMEVVKKMQVWLVKQLSGHVASHEL